MKRNDILLQRMQRHATVAALLRPETPVSAGVSRLAVQTAKLPAAATTPTAIQAQPDEVEAEVPAPTTEDGAPDREWRRLQTIFNRHQKKQSREADAGAHESAGPPPPQVQLSEKGGDEQQPETAEAPRPEVAATGQVQLAGEPKRQRSETAVSSDLTDTAINQPQHTHFTEQAVKETDLVTAVVTQLAADEDVPRAQPLETAWPVQMVERSSPAGKPPNVSQQPETISPEQSAAPYDDTVLRGTLSDVTAYKPSDSSVELVPPRRPRPPAESETSQAVQRHPAPGVEEPPASVETEIGPLPADLWEMLGEEPPQVTTTRQPEPEADPDGGTDMAADSVLEGLEQTSTSRPADTAPLATSQVQTKPDHEPDTVVEITSTVPDAAPTDTAVDVIQSRQEPPANAEDVSQTTAAPDPGTQSMSAEEPAAIRAAIVSSSDAQQEVLSEDQRQLPTTPGGRGPESATTKIQQPDAPTLAFAPEVDIPDASLDAQADPQIPDAVAAEDRSKRAKIEIGQSVQVKGSQDARETREQGTGQILQTNTTVPAAASLLSRSQDDTVQSAQPKTIQRADEAAETTETAATADPASDQEDEETEAAEVDIDELTRQVYSNLKRRLAREWERARNR